MLVAITLCRCDAPASAKTSPSRYSCLIGLDSSSARYSASLRRGCCWGSVLISALTAAHEYSQRPAARAACHTRTPVFADPRDAKGGEGGIRTHEGLLSLTRFPGERPKPD